MCQISKQENQQKFVLKNVFEHYLFILFFTSFEPKGDKEGGFMALCHDLLRLHARIIVNARF